MDMTNDPIEPMNPNNEDKVQAGPEAELMKASALLMKLARESQSLLNYPIANAAFAFLAKELVHCPQLEVMWVRGKNGLADSLTLSLADDSLSIPAKFLKSELALELAAGAMRAERSKPSRNEHALSASSHENEVAQNTAAFIDQLSAWPTRSTSLSELFHTVIESMDPSVADDIIAHFVEHSSASPENQHWKGALIFAESQAIYLTEESESQPADRPKIEIPTTNGMSILISKTGGALFFTPSTGGATIGFANTGYANLFTTLSPSEVGPALREFIALANASDSNETAYTPNIDRITARHEAKVDTWQAVRRDLGTEHNGDKVRLIYYSGDLSMPYDESHLSSASLGSWISEPKHLVCVLHCHDSDRDATEIFIDQGPAYDILTASENGQAGVTKLIQSQCQSIWRHRKERFAGPIPSFKLAIPVKADTALVAGLTSENELTTRPLSLDKKIPPGAFVLSVGNRDEGSWLYMLPQNIPDYLTAAWNAIFKQDTN